MANDIVNSSISVHCNGTDTVFELKGPLTSEYRDDYYRLQLRGKRQAGLCLDLYLSTEQVDELHRLTESPVTFGRPWRPPDQSGQKMAT